MAAETIPARASTASLRSGDPFIHQWPGSGGPGCDPRLIRAGVAFLAELFRPEHRPPGRRAPPNERIQRNSHTQEGGSAMKIQPVPAGTATDRAASESSPDSHPTGRYRPDGRSKIASSLLVNGPRATPQPRSGRNTDRSRCLGFRSRNLPGAATCTETPAPTSCFGRNTDQACL